MSQTRKGSAIETVASTAIGFGVSYVANIIILPLYGYQVTHGDAFGMSIIFTVLSLIRGFYVRRLFNKIKRWHHAPVPANVSDGAFHTEAGYSMEELNNGGKSQ